MKKTIVPIAFLTLSTCAIAQGYINYSIRLSGSLVTHVYGPEVADPGAVKFGNTASELPAGTQAYTGPLLTGSGWSAQLFGAPGSGQPESSLTPVPYSITTFRTGATLGGTITPTGTPNSNGYLAIPGTIEGGNATFQLRVWDNLGGTVPSWTEAQPLWVSGGIAAGKSTVFDVFGLGTDDIGAFGYMYNFRSFNAYFIPEPGVFALASLGAAALLLFRRRS